MGIKDVVQHDVLHICRKPSEFQTFSQYITLVSIADIIVSIADIIHMASWLLPGVNLDGKERLKLLAHDVSRSFCLPDHELDFDHSYRMCYYATLTSSKHIELTFAYAIQRAIVFLLETVEGGSVGTCRTRFEARLGYMVGYTLYWRGHQAHRDVTRAAGEAIRAIAEVSWTMAVKKVQHTRLLLLRNGGIDEGLAERVQAESME